MTTQGTVINVGPLDNREAVDSVNGSTRITWSIKPGDSTLTIVLRYAQPHSADFVTNGSVRLDSTCDDSQAWLTDVGYDVVAWHAQTLNGTALIGHGGRGVVFDRSVRAEFTTEQALLAAFHSGETIGKLTFQGPDMDKVAILPLDRLLTAEGGPGMYETKVDALGGTGVWGFMVGVSPVEA